MSNPLILLTGCCGQLGRGIRQNWEANPINARFELLPVDLDQLDLTDAEDLVAFLNQLHPTFIINTAAYTNVDEAEKNRQIAYAVNADAVRSLAEWCQASGCRLIHISTDFVFDGTSKTPYATDAQGNPLNVYGASKLAGESHVLELLPDTGYVVRTSWLYSEYGNNFVKTMIRLMKNESVLKVVNDQIGSPTSVHTLAHFLFELILNDANAGVYHWCDGGEISWFHFAQEINQQGRADGLIHSEVTIQPILASDYPTLAKRPSYSVLERSESLALIEGVSENWQSALKRVLGRLTRISRSADENINE